jgi:hypothetical protein
MSMSGVLAIAALAVLAGLGLLSLKRQRESEAIEKRRVDAMPHAGEAQHERSLSRRADVRSAHDHAEEIPADALPSLAEPGAGTSPKEGP